MSLDIQPIDYHETQESLHAKLAARLQALRTAPGVLILADGAEQNAPA